MASTWSKTSNLGNLKILNWVDRRRECLENLQKIQTKWIRCWETGWEEQLEINWSEKNRWADWREYPDGNEKKPWKNKKQFVLISSKCWIMIEKLVGTLSRLYLGL